MKSAFLAAVLGGIVASSFGSNAFMYDRSSKTIPHSKSGTGGTISDAARQKARQKKKKRK